MHGATMKTDSRIFNRVCFPKLSFSEEVTFVGNKYDCDKILCFLAVAYVRALMKVFY
jgi:hypothetical protein